jgi:hypothetical protein
VQLCKQRYHQIECFCSPRSCILSPLVVKLLQRLCSSRKNLPARKAGCSTVAGSSRRRPKPLSEPLLALSHPAERKRDVVLFKILRVRLDSSPGIRRIPTTATDIGGFVVSSQCSSMGVNCSIARFRCTSVSSAYLGSCNAIMTSPACMRLKLLTRNDHQ